jgi:EmrB/QacA subfamily drug resistance transporter
VSRVPTTLLAARARIRAHRRWRWLALLVVAGGMMLSVVNVSIVNIALPEMAADLGVDVPTIGWVFTGFLVTQATFLAVAGRAGDLYGRRRVFVAGVTVLVVGSVLCALSWNAPSLVAFRVLQGMGACAMAPTAFAYAAELFAPHERGTAMGVMGGVISIAPVVALNVAGGLVGAFGWRSVFWFSPIMGAVVLAAAALVLDERRGSDRRRRFDISGALLAAVGLFSVLLALSRGGAWGWTAPPTLAALLGGLAVLGLLLLHEHRTPDPMLDLGLLRMRSLATPNLASVFSAAALFGVIILLPFYFTAVLGFTAVELGLAITPVAGSFMLVAPLAGRNMLRVGSVRMATAGFVIATGGALWMAFSAPAETYFAMLPGILLFGVGLAMCTAPITTTAVSEVPRRSLGVASSLPNLSRYIGGALGAAILSAVLGAAVPARLERPNGIADIAGRDLVASGFRTSALVAAGFLATAAVIASRMPRLDPTRRVPTAPAGTAASSA